MIKTKFFLSISFLFLSFLSAAPAFPAEVAASSWAGQYLFEGDYGRTAGGTGIVVAYTLTVTPKQDGLSGEISASGWQTWQRLECDMKVEGNQLVVYFNKYLEGDYYTHYQKGDRLLALEKTPVKKRFLARLAAYKIDPSLDQKKIYFTKSPSPQ